MKNAAFSAICTTFYRAAKTKVIIKALGKLNTKIKRYKIKILLFLFVQQKNNVSLREDTLWDGWMDGDEKRRKPRVATGDN